MLTLWLAFIMIRNIYHRGTLPVLLLLHAVSFHCVIKFIPKRLFNTGSDDILLLPLQGTKVLEALFL